jgi:hypothetical protein
MTRHATRRTPRQRAFASAPAGRNIAPVTETSVPHPIPTEVVVALVGTPGADAAPLALALKSAGVASLAADLWGIGASHVDSYSEQILAAGQAAWWAPPERSRWMDEPEVIALVQQQRQAITSSLGSTGRSGAAHGAVWFDQRHSLLLDLWLGGDLPITGTILLWRPPGQAVQALQRDGIRHQHALALWEDAMHCTLTALVGRRVLVCNPDHLIDDESRAAALLSFLDTCGLAHTTTPSALSSALTEHVPASPPNANSPGTESDLVALLESRNGEHQSLAPFTEIPRSPGAEEMLDAHRAIYRLTAEARSAWLRADRADREAADALAQLTQSMSGIDVLVNHLLNAM